MKTKDFPTVKQAELIAKIHSAYHNEMMKKGDKMKKLFLVETISTFKQTYVVEAEELEHAFDEVTMIPSGNPNDAFAEAEQVYLGETITGGRKISKKEFRKLLEQIEKHGTGSHWLGEGLIRRINYEDGG